MARRIRLETMRFLYRLLFSSVLILAAGCSAPKDTSYKAPTPEATLSLYRPGFPVETRLTAAAIGRQLLEAQEGFTWIESPKAVLAKEMSYADANRRIGLGDAQYDLWPEQTRVWFVIFKGRWKLIPLGPTQAPPLPVTYDGCLLLVFTVRDASLISTGDSICPAY